MNGEQGDLKRDHNILKIKLAAFALGQKKRNQGHSCNEKIPRRV